MAPESNLSRCRQSSQRLLAQLDGLEQRSTACDSQSLASTLQDIGRRKAAQGRRLRAWLEQNQHGFEATGTTAAPVDESASDPEQDAPREQVAVDADNAPVLERREVSPDLLVFRVARPPDFSFSAGQSVKLGIDGLTRTYSLVSAPHEPFLEFFVELVPGGQMSGRLHQLQPGDTVSLGPPKGGLRFDDQAPRHLMVATVTGINPFISMVRDRVQRGAGGHHLYLMHGASYQREFGYREELEAIAASHPDLLTYLPTVSRPDEADNQSWAGQTGRVDGLVNAIITQEGLRPENTRVYACGHSGMLASVARVVQPLGFSLETESYD